MTAMPSVMLLVSGPTPIEPRCRRCRARGSPSRARGGATARRRRPAATATAIASNLLGTGSAGVRTKFPSVPSGGAEPLGPVSEIDETHRNQVVDGEFCAETALGWALPLHSTIPSLREPKPVVVRQLLWSEMREIRLRGNSSSFFFGACLPRGTQHRSLTFSFEWGDWCGPPGGGCAMSSDNRDPTTGSY